MDVLTSNIDLIKTYNSYHTHPINKAIALFVFLLSFFYKRTIKEFIFIK